MASIFYSRVCLCTSICECIGYPYIVMYSKSQDKTHFSDGDGFDPSLLTASRVCMYNKYSCWKVKGERWMTKKEKTDPARESYNNANCSLCTSILCTRMEEFKWVSVRPVSSLHVWQGVVGESGQARAVSPSFFIPWSVDWTSALSQFLNLCSLLPSLPATPNRSLFYCCPPQQCRT